jgi:hypothetical protein
MSSDPNFVAKLKARRLNLDVSEDITGRGRVQRRETVGELADKH